MTGKKIKTLFAGVKFCIICILSPPPLPSIYLLSKTWSGQIMKLAVTGNQSNQRISYECVVNGTNRLFPKDDKSLLSVFNVNM